eukprot:6293362-Alexandrium_andersonii.AAC.1
MLNDGRSCPLTSVQLSSVVSGLQVGKMRSLHIVPPRMCALDGRCFGRRPRFRASAMPAGRS